MMRRFLVVALLVLPGLAHGAWPSSGSWTAWSAKFKLTSQSSIITAACDYYVLDLSLMPALFWSSVAADGDDIRCTQDDGETQVDYHLAYWDYGNTDGVLVIEQPHGASGATVDVDTYLYVGNAGAAAGTTSGAYPSAMQGHWWLQEQPTSATAIKDATANARNSTSIMGTMTSGDLVADAPYGNMKSIDFDGNDGITISSTVLDAGETASRFTISGWAKPSDASADRALMGTSGAQLNLYRENTGTVGWYGEARNSANSANFTTTATSGSTGAWQKVDFVWNGSNIYLYLNGSQISSAACTSWRSATLAWNLGYANGVWMVGQIGPCFVRSDALTADQIYTLHACESSNSTFWAISEVVVCGSGTTGLKLFGSNSQTSTANANWNDLGASLIDDATTTDVTLDDGGVYLSETITYAGADLSGVPTDATSYTVTLHVKRKREVGASLEINDVVVRFRDGSGTLQGDNLANVAGNWPTSAATASYPLTGYTPDGTDFTSSTGFDLQATGFDTNGATLAEVLTVWIEVDWEGAPCDEGSNWFSMWD